MKLTKRKAKQLEEAHGVFVNRETMSYNYHGHDSATGWTLIPIKWFQDVQITIGLE